MSKGWRLAVVGATGTLGEAMLRVLEESELPVELLAPLASERSVGRQVEFRGDEHAVSALEGFDFRSVDFALFALPAALTEAYAPLAAEAGAVVVDASGAFAGDAQVPLVAATLNPAALAGYAARQIVRSPAGLALALARVLAPVEARFGLASVNVAGYHAVVGHGRAAVDELAAQCGQLLNGRPMTAPGPAFSTRIAFNCLAGAGVLEPDGRTETERAVEADFARLLGLTSPDFAYTAVTVPVFYGDGAAVTLATREAAAPAALAALFAAQAGVLVDRGAAIPSPAGEAVGRDEVHLGRLRALGGAGRSGFWLVADLLRLTARNSVNLVEVLAREHF